MYNISFQAQININRNLIQKKMVSDNFFDVKKEVNLFKTLDDVESLSCMKEGSIVDIVPRLDHNQLNLITSVSDQTGLVRSIISERSARKISSNENFAMRFLSNIKNTIQNAEMAKNQTDLINEFVKKSKTLNDDNFISKLPKLIFEKLSKGYNPTQRIMYVLKKIEEKYPYEINKLSIITERKTTKLDFYPAKCVTYFCLNNTKGETRMVIHNLLKDPAYRFWG